MIRDITIGQYYSGNSVIHRLNPRTKLFVTVMYAISVFLCKNLIMVAAATVFLCVYIAMSTVPVTFICRGLKLVWTMVVFTAVFSIFGSSGTVLWSWHGLKITEQSLMSTFLMAVRVVYLVIGSAVMTYTTRPISLANGLEKSLGFLKRFGAPVSEMAMMLMIALRFIPIFMEELDKIMKAQLSRGADFESGNIIRRLKSYVPVFIPLFVSAVRRATDLANAMDARCYSGSSERTKMNPLVYTSIDYVAYVVVILYVAALVAYRVVCAG